MQLRPSFLQVLLLLSCFWFSLSATSHEVRPAIIDLDFNDKGSYQLKIRLNLEALMADVNNKDTSEDENSQKYDQLRTLSSKQLENKFNSFAPYFKDQLFLRFDNVREKFSQVEVTIPEVGDIELARDSIILITGITPNNSKTTQWKWGKKFGNAALRVSTPQNKELYSTYLLEGKQSDIIPLNLSSINPSVQKHKKGGRCTSLQCKWDVFTNYVEVGFVHIMPLGLDHILFVVGLFLLSASLRPLLIQVTTFTLAHSVTLALGVYGVVNLSPTIVEPLIAASIIYVCIENIYSNKLSRWRPLIIFLFGLLHGLGFAGVLKEIGLSSENFVTGLIAFNIGVELGQLSVIAICFILVGFWFRNKPWYRNAITIPASSIVALIAGYWFLERVNWI